MISTYKYALKKSGKIVGHFSSTRHLIGHCVVIREVSLFKQKYNAKVKEIRVEIRYEVKDDGVTISATRYLDVTRKSLRQIEIIKKSSL